MKINQLIIRRLLLTAGSLLVAGQLHADVLAAWNMTNTTVANMQTPTIVDAGVVTANNLTGNNLGTPVSVGPVNPPFALNYIGQNRSGSSGGNPGDLSLDAVLADATYFSFTITPVSGQTITINSLSLDAMVSTASTTANREFFVLSSATGFNDTSVLLAGATQSELNNQGNAANNNGQGGEYTFTTPRVPYNSNGLGYPNPADQNYSVDLSGNSLLANLTSPVTFRIYVGTDTVSQNVGFSQITVNGVVVPEPSVYALAGLGFLLSIGKWRQARKA